MIEAFRTRLALLIDPKYETLKIDLAEVLKENDELKTSDYEQLQEIQRLQHEVASLTLEQDRHAKQLAEIGKYKANYRLMAEALKGISTPDGFYGLLTGWQQKLPHKDLK